jgi:hypothetical protein
MFWNAAPDTVSDEPVKEFSPAPTRHTSHVTRHFPYFFALISAEYCTSSQVNFNMPLSTAIVN